ncbi:MAG: efflux RND transporter periplasmic adaptor subunit [Chitinophagaceae bacterium]
MKQINNLMLLILFAACAGKTEKKQEEVVTQPSNNHITITSAQIRNAGIQTGVVSRSDISETLVVNGEVDVPPQAMVSVSFPFGGYLRSTSMIPGKAVRRGEVIAVMEDQSLIQLQEEFLSGKVKLKFLEQEFKRQKELNINRVNSDKIMQQTESDFTTQQVFVKSREEKLKLIGIDPGSLDINSISKSVVLRSPINGYVSDVKVNIGQYVQPTAILFDIINPNDIHAALHVFEKDLPKVGIGQKVMISFIEQPEKEYEGSVILSKRNVDENRTALIHCHFHQKPSFLMPGMFITGKILVKSNNVPVVPAGALVQYGNRNYIFTSAAEGTFDLTPVETGTRFQDLVELINGNELIGRKIVIANAYSVLGALKNVAE